MEHIDVVKRAGLKVRAVDSSPLALLRAVPPGGEGLEVVVSLGINWLLSLFVRGRHPGSCGRSREGTRASPGRGKRA